MDGEEFNEDELCAPEWMNKEYFEKILRDTSKDDTMKVFLFSKIDDFN